MSRSRTALRSVRAERLLSICTVIAQIVSSENAEFRLANARLLKIISVLCNHGCRCTKPVIDKQICSVFASLAMVSVCDVSQNFVHSAAELSKNVEDCTGTFVADTIGLESSDAKCFHSPNHDASGLCRSDACCVSVVRDADRGERRQHCFHRCYSIRCALRDPCTRALALANG